jgi:membrane-associated phospholipid phosphatase
MYVGNHYPSDVFAGALLGYSIGEVTLRCETVTKLFFKKEKFHQKK